jgi:tRNA U34 5-methylaminomethyl-2-thiouridine-forming methyltransferase MnmC
MEREIIITKDGSNSISVPGLNVTYHSIYGAIQESRHVFIEAGLKHLLNQSANKQICILEVGFGTGLNALLTAIEVEGIETTIYYVALEPFPISLDEANSLNYCKQLQRKDLEEGFIRIHNCEWNKSIVVTENILMHKSNDRLQTFDHTTRFDLIYYDAFAPNAQPELWTKEIFEKLFHLLLPGGILVTYCSKGDVRRAMIAAGFEVKKLPGAPGKREMLRAIRPTTHSS